MKYEIYDFRLRFIIMSLLSWQWNWRWYSVPEHKSVSVLSTWLLYKGCLFEQDGQMKFSCKLSLLICFLVIRVCPWTALWSVLTLIWSGLIQVCHWILISSHLQWLTISNANGFMHLMELSCITECKGLNANNKVHWSTNMRQLWKHILFQLESSHLGKMIWNQSTERPVGKCVENIFGMNQLLSTTGRS